MPRNLSVNLDANVSGFVRAFQKAGDAAAAMALKAEKSALAADNVQGRLAKAAEVQAKRSAFTATQTGQAMVRARMAVQAADAKMTSAIGAGGNAALRAAGKVASGYRTVATAASTAKETAKQAFDAMSNDAAGQHLRTLGRGVRNVGLVLAGLGVAAIKVSADFDQAMSQVAMTGTDARAQLTGLREAALKAGTTTNYSATEAAQGLELLAKAGVSASDSINGGLTGSLNLAAAGGLDVGDAAEIAATAMAQFELKGQDMGHIADLLAAGAGKAQGSVQQLGYALKYVGPVAHGMGISIDETVGTLAEFANAGILGEQAGTSFRGVLLALTSPSKVASAAMKDLGINLYDGKGKFIGMKGAADELSQGMKDLSEADRNYYLGRIFGNAQITAARVLLKGAGKGVQDWTDKVNDANYAADAARIRMDNLKGDVQKLGRAFQTFLIGAGDGAQSPFRSIVEGATKAVNVLNKLPVEAQGALVSTGLGLGAMALGVSGVLGGLSKLGDTKDAMTSLGMIGADATRAGKGMVYAGKAALGLAAAFATIQVAGALESFLMEAPPKIEDVTRELAQLGAATKSGGDAFAVAGSKLDSYFSISTKHDLIPHYTGSAFHKDKTNIDGLAGALQRLYNPTKSQSFEATAGGFLAKIGFGPDVAAQLKTRVGEIDDGLNGLMANGQVDAAQHAFQGLTGQFKAAGLNADQIREALPKLNEQLVQQAAALGVTSLNAQDYVDWMGGKVPVAIAEASKHTADGTKAILDNAAAFQKTREILEAMVPGTKRSAEQNDALAKALFTVGDAAQSGVSAHSAWSAAIDDSGEAIKKANTDLDLHKGYLSDDTKEQRDSIAALDGLASSGKEWVRSLIEQGAGSKAAADATGKVREQFLKAADAAGLGKDEAKKLADQYGLIPKEVSTTVNAFVDAMQQSQVNDFIGSLQGLPLDVKTHIYAIYEKDGAAAALKELNILDGTYAYPKILTKSDAKEVSKSASDMLAAIKDGKPHVKTGSNAKTVTDQAKAFLRSIHDVDPKVLTKADLKAAKAAQALVNSMDGKVANSYVNIYTKQYTSAHDAAHPDQQRRAAGGYISGPGTATSDSIPAWLSDGEFVLRARAVKAIGLAKLHEMNAQGFASGGAVGPSSPGTVVMYGFDVPSILRLVQAVANPVADLKKLTADVASAQKAVLAASDKGAIRRKNRAEDKRDDDKARVARDKARVTKLRDDARDEKAGSKARKRITAEINLALKKQHTDEAAAKKSAAAYSKASTAATKATEKLKDAQDKLKEAQDALTSKKQEVADAARATADTARSAYNTQSTSGWDWIKSMTQGAEEITAFTGTLQQLRKKGLNEAIIAQIMQMGAAAGTELAKQILQGGSTMIYQLNVANKNLQSAANSFGFFGAMPKFGGGYHFADGGYVAGAGTGTSDSIPARLSNGEYVVNAAATAANRALLEQINDGRRVVDVRPVQAFRYGGPVAPAPLIDTAALAAAVRAGMAGLRMSATVNGDTVEMVVDRALGGFVGQFGRGNA